MPGRTDILVYKNNTRVRTNPNFTAIETHVHFPIISITNSDHKLQ